VAADTNRSGGSSWAVLLVIGVIALIIGIIVIFNPFDSVRFLTVVIGISLITSGVLGIVASLRGRSRIGVAAPIVALIGGLVLVFIPEGSVKTAAIVVGVILLAFGIVTMVVAFTARKEGGWVPILAGLAVAVIGLIVVVWPGPTLALLAILAGISIVLFGVGMIAQAFRERR
jgi:uncharacterized membrane protein HdeD (DUF308 family)